MSTENGHRTDRYFWGIIGILALFLVVVGCQLYTQHSREKEATEAILKAQSEYFSLQYQKFDLLSQNDTLQKHPDLYAAYAKALRTEVSKDSVAWKSGAEAAMRDVKSLVEIHLQTIDRQYYTLSLWAAVLTIVFLIFNFYSIFKLESTLAEAKSQITKLDGEMQKQMKDMENLKSKMNTQMENFSTEATKQMDRIKDEATQKVKAIVDEAEKERKKSQLFSDGLRALEQKEYDKAIQYYQDFLKLDPDNTAVHYNLGNAYSDNKEYKEAIEAYNKAIKLDPNDADFYNNLGITYNDKKEYDKAIEAYLKAIKISPKHADAHHNLGIVYMAIKDWENAEKYLNEALNFSPEDEMTKKAIAELKKLRAADKTDKTGKDS